MKRMIVASKEQQSDFKSLIEDLGWEVVDNSKPDSGLDITISKDSPLGYEFIMTISAEDVKDAFDKIKKEYYEFSIDDCVDLMIEDDWRSREPGADRSAFEEDAEAVESMLEELVNSIEALIH